VDDDVYFVPDGPKKTVEPKEMTIQDIQDAIEDYVHAAKLAIEAGFDGVEVHSANGYLLDQFICDNINIRTDAYGGGIENRGRLVLEVVDAVVAAVGADRVGVRFSPFSTFQGTNTRDIIGDYGYLIDKMDSKGLAYVHLVEPRSDLFLSRDEKRELVMANLKAKGIPEEKLDYYLTLKPFRELLKNTPLIVAGGFNDKNSAAPVDAGEFDVVVMGRPFISNPDVVDRIRNGWPLAPWDRNTFYTSGTKGYTDYQTYKQESSSKI
jgi:N-ethylmaleimide reductase